ncbi:hypothetical protein [Paraburkholderia sp. BCC1884]|uniref:hypothetical protein n=1 Tax=Paraburkholderia sp. BCC1884 TaxID=2562668 RepID=UPI0011838DFA|nr:hypothetical protein [Paraburkholderia sp. BCC1884]
MTTVNVQFSDNTETTVISFFGGPQDADVFPNQGALDTSDPRWETYYKTAYPNGAPSFCNIPAPSKDGG